MITGLPTNAMLENIATMLISGGVVVALYALGAGAFSAVGLVLLLNIQYVRHQSERSSKGGVK